MPGRVRLLYALRGNDDRAGNTKIRFRVGSENRDARTANRQKRCLTIHRIISTLDTRTIAGAHDAIDIEDGLYSARNTWLQDLRHLHCRYRSQHVCSRPQGVGQVVGLLFSALLLPIPPFVIYLVRRKKQTKKANV